MTPEGYYIHHGNQREGPLDTTQLMHKLRAGKVDGNTPISTTYSGDIHPLHAYPALTPLLAAPAGVPPRAEKLRAETLFKWGIVSGARLINRQLQLCVITGIVVFLLLVIATVVGSATTFLGGYLVWLFTALTLHPVLQLITLRMFRGHYAGVASLRQYVFAHLPALLTMGAYTAITVISGITCLLIPGILIYTLLLYTVPICVDENCNATTGIRKSLRMISRGGIERFGALFGLASINILSILVIIPLPILWPMILGGVAELYEDAAV